MLCCLVVNMAELLLLLLLLLPCPRCWQHTDTAPTVSSGFTRSIESKYHDLAIKTVHFFSKKPIFGCTLPRCPAVPVPLACTCFEHEGRYSPRIQQHDKYKNDLKRALLEARGSFIVFRGLRRPRVIRQIQWLALFCVLFVENKRGCATVQCILSPRRFHVSTDNTTSYTRETHA